MADIHVVISVNIDESLGIIHVDRKRFRTVYHNEEGVGTIKVGVL